MTLTKAFTIVGICLVVGAVIGGLIGWFIGMMFPEAYAWSRRDPVHIGVGLGIPQGVTLGAFIGVLLTAIMAWYDVNTRSYSSFAADPEDE